MENWRSVLGYEGIYIASDHGRISRIGGWTDGRKNRIKGQRRLKAAKYLRVTLFRDKSRKEYPVHRLVYEAFNGPMPIGTEINHKNGKKYDNRLENLEAIFHLENVRHSLKVLGKAAAMPRGSRHHNTHLTEDDVRKMRQLRFSGTKLKDLTLLYGISMATVCQITKGRLWKHVY